MNLDSLTGPAFVTVGLALLLLERAATGAQALQFPWNRWLTNLGLLLCGGFAAAVTPVESVTEAAALLEGGLIGNIGLPLVVEVVVVFLLIDCWRYWEHRLLHEIPVLWRIHLVHHSDTAVDVTTAERHHPLEGLLAGLLLLLLLFALGFSVTALSTYILVATVSSLYTHTTLRLPERLDRRLRYWLVTPSVHAVHHSADRAQTNSNYGGVLSIWDRLFGTYRDPAIEAVQRFGLEQFRRPKDSTLAAALVQPIWYRPGHRDAPETPQSSPSQSAAVALSPQWRSTLRFGIAGSVLVLLGMWPTVLDLANQWSRADTYQYAWLVAPMFIYLLCWHHRDQLLAAKPSPGYPGCWLILVAVAAWIVGAIADIRLGQHLGLVIALQGVALCALGWRVYRQYLPLMFLLFFAVPGGDIFLTPLRELTVLWIDWFGTAMGYPVVREGYAVYIGDHGYVVVDACAGLGVFLMAGFLGYSFGLMLYGALRPVLALAALSACLGIASNAVRVCTIVALDQLRGSQMPLDAHHNIQTVVLLFLLALLLFAAHRLPQGGGINTRPPGAEAHGCDRRLLAQAPMLAGLAVAASIALFHMLLLADRAPDLQAGGIARALAERHPHSQRLAGSDENAVGIVTMPVARDSEVRIYESSAVNARLPESRLLQPAGTGWHHSDSAAYRQCTGHHCLPFTRNLWLRTGGRERFNTVSAYYVGDAVMISRLKFRLLSGWHRLRGQATARGMVSFHLGDRDPDEFDLVTEFQKLRAPVPAAPGPVAASRHG